MLQTGGSELVFDTYKINKKETKKTLTHFATCERFVDENESPEKSGFLPLSHHLIIQALLIRSGTAEIA